MEFMKRTYQDLNEEQREAVVHNAGPALILAGRGRVKPVSSPTGFFD